LKQSLETIRSEARAIIIEVNDYIAQLAKDREAEVMAGLNIKVEATLQMFVDNDMRDNKGQLAQSTLDAISVQGYVMHDGKLVPAVLPPPEKANPP
jgi:hypothetical protein